MKMTILDDDHGIGLPAAAQTGHGLIVQAMKEALPLLDTGLDEWTRRMMRWHFPWDGVAQVRPVAGSQAEAAEGVY
jgi:hypothetical protein